MKILVINVDIPFPPVGSGLMHRYQLLQALARKNEITFAAYTYK